MSRMSGSIPAVVNVTLVIFSFGFAGTLIWSILAPKNPLPLLYSIIMLSIVAVLAMVKEGFRGGK